jgi:DNA-binding CsgD family transcriptional regulator
LPIDDSWKGRSQMTLLGRLDEQRAVDRVVGAAREGLSGALVLRGEPGIGKTALMGYAVDTAPDFEVAYVAGTENEMAFGFAGLHRLLLPFMSRLADLPGAEVEAARSAFGLVDGPPADRLVVGLAALAVLGDLATERPVLCVVDDAHSLDQESLDALALVGRRLLAEGIAILFASREPLDALSGIPELRIGGLGPSAAIDLFKRTADGPVDDEVARHVAEETEGSPMVIIELARDGSSRDLLSASAVQAPLPVSRRIEAHFLRRVRQLPVATQTFLLVLAADTSQDAAVVARAAGTLGIGPGAVEPARAAEVIVADLRFRHPLIRSSVYAGAALAERRRAHHALAAATPESDLDRRAWHLAAASIGSNEPVAADLERTARRATSRGAHSAAAAAWQRAAELTADYTLRAGRILAGAEAHLLGGAPAEAEDTLAVASQHLSDPFHRACAQRLIGAARYASGETAGTASMLVDAARGLERVDLELARATMLQALAAARVTGRFTAAGEDYRDIAIGARAMPRPQEAEMSIPYLIIQGHAALFLDGHESAMAALRRAIDALHAGDDSSNDALLWMATGCWAAGAIGDERSLHSLALRLEGRARERGALVALSHGLMFLAMSDILDGSLHAARGHLAERAQIMSAMGRPSDVGELMVSAWTGQEAAARSEADEVARRAAAIAHGWMLPFVEYSLAVLELGLGNYRAAFDSSTKDPLDNPFLSLISTPDLIEAAARCDQRSAAEDALGGFEARAVPSGTPLALGLLARCRALLADDAHAEELYQRSLTSLRRCRGDLQMARTHLVYGEWLRRLRRRIDAREQLRMAHAIFERAGADGFAERARIEIAATGASARRRTVDTRNELTAQEAEIAHLASSGVTNAEIASKLFLSRSTVDHHLRNVYRKLGIASRRELPDDGGARSMSPGGA